MQPWILTPRMKLQLWTTATIWKTIYSTSTLRSSCNLWHYIKTNHRASYARSRINWQLARSEITQSSKDTTLWSNSCRVVAAKLFPETNMWPRVSRLVRMEKVHLSLQCTKICHLAHRLILSTKLSIGRIKMNSLASEWWARSVLLSLLWVTLIRMIPK